MLASELGLEAARSFDALLQQQHESDLRAALPLPPDELDLARGRDLARYSHGAGGGRRRPSLAPDA